MSLRREFVRLISVEGANMAATCRQFGVSRQTGYKWLTRFREEGDGGLVDQSRRPRTMRCPTPPEMEARVLAVRDEHPAWGGRKIRARLELLGVKNVPAASTITAILRRNGRISPKASDDRTHYGSFERSAPNDLWQIDFKGEFRMTNKRYCYPLTMIDDHSRFAVGLFACDNQRRMTVQQHFIAAFRRYGMPQAIYSDNGPPYGAR
ncbi:DDE-type integrase/transposase/recombinase [bacterium]|nr:DDE-type integrase/transposase/recombinase [bacterium]